MSVPDNYRPVETVGDLKTALADYDDSAKLEIMFSPNGLLALSLESSEWKELYLTVRKAEATLEKPKPVQIVAGENFAEINTTAVEKTLDEEKILFIKDKLLYLAGRKDERVAKGLMAGGFSFDLTEEEYAWILDSIAFDKVINPENQHSQN